LPDNPEEEHHVGAQLTAYLRRGSNLSSPTFTSKSSRSDSAPRSP
jgi:hypothetical protein